MTIEERFITVIFLISLPFIILWHLVYWMLAGVVVALRSVIDPDW